MWRVLILGRRGGVWSVGTRRGEPARAGHPGNSAAHPPLVSAPLGADTPFRGPGRTRSSLRWNHRERGHRHGRHRRPQGCSGVDGPPGPGRQLL